MDFQVSRLNANFNTGIYLDSYSGSNCREVLIIPVENNVE